MTRADKHLVATEEDLDWKERTGLRKKPVLPVKRIKPDLQRPFAMLKENHFDSGQ